MAATLDTRHVAPEDAALPTLGPALDPAVAGPALAGRVPAHLTGGVGPTVRDIRLVAHKPGRRALIEYTLGWLSPNGPREVALLGKIRVNRFGNSGYRQLRALWDAALDARSPHGVSVPEPVATVPALRMWLQRRVEGQVARARLLSTDATDIARRIAVATHVLHTSGVEGERRHTMAAEMRILERCLGEVAGAHPDLARGVAELAAACGRAAALLPEPLWCGSHRDFYADQVLVSDTRVTIVGFDLYCEADPGLDLGNFIGHVAEHSLRFCGHDAALAPVERALEDTFVSRAGDGVRLPVRVYTALTLARHVFLCTRFPDRAPLLSPVLAAAQRRIGVVLAECGHA